MIILGILSITQQNNPELKDTTDREKLVDTAEYVEAAKNELLAKAVADSKTKAEVLTTAAGVKLGEILTIDYSWGEIEFVSRSVNRLAEPMMAYGAAEEDSYDFDIEPDDIDVEDTVTVIWELAK